MNCDHKTFETMARITRINEVENGPITEYRLEISTRCVNCNENLIFEGLPAGYSTNNPTVSFDQKELRVPATIKNIDLTTKLN